MRSFLIAGLLGIAFVGAIPAQGQMDVAKALEGKWEGEFVKESRDKFENARTLIIGKVREEGGKWIIERARYGITGKELGPIDVKLNVEGDKVALAFETQAQTKNPVKLSLAPDGTLGGSIYLAGVGSKNNPQRPFKLRKVE
jgi:hypothetical protein